MPERLVTFDVWDTLLRRHCDPEAVKLFTCRGVLLLYPGALGDRWLDAWQLLAMRHQIESELVRAGRAAGNDGEYKLGEVLRPLVRRCVRPGVSDDEAQRIAERLERLEIAQERFVAYADPTIGQLITEQGDASLSFLSDFHLPRDEVAALLRHNGFVAVAADGMVSCDTRLSKRSGRLFAKVRDARPAGAGSWLHIGDDPVADVAAPSRLGIATRQFRPADQTRQRDVKAALLGRPFRTVRDGVRVAVDAADATGNAARRPFARLGGAASPLFAGYALWLLETALERKADQLVFLGPQADFLEDVYRRLACVFSGAYPGPLVAARAGTGASGPLQAPEPASLQTMLADLTGEEIEPSAPRSVGLHLRLLACATAPPQTATTRDALTYLPVQDLDSGRASAAAFRAAVALCGEPKGQADAVTIARSRTGGTVPVAPPDAIAAFQTGVLAGVDHLARTFRIHAITSDDVAPWADASWRTWLERVPSVLAAAAASPAPLEPPDQPAQLVRSMSARARASLLKRAVMRRAPSRGWAWLTVPAMIRTTRRLRLWRGR